MIAVLSITVFVLLWVLLGALGLVGAETIRRVEADPDRYPQGL